MGAHVAIKATWNEAGGGPAHLLMAALHGAVALMQVHDVAVAVREDLHLDVARLLDEALDPAALVVLDDAVLAWLVDLCDQDGALLAVLLVELNGLRERELADDVAVEDEEVAAIRAENVPGECERAG